MQLPQYLNLLPTYLCNARCQICNIWQQNPESQSRKSEEMTLEFYARLFADPWLAELRHISISGGEPFLYPQLVELVKLIPKHVVVTIATNASVPLLVVRPMLSELAFRAQFHIQISLDGTESVHNQLRGLPTAYQTAMELVTALKQQHIPYYFSMVINTRNYAELDAVYKLAKQNDTFVQFNPIHSGDYYLMPELKELTNWTEEQIAVVEQQLEKIIPDLVTRNKITSEEIEFYQQIPDYLRHGSKKPKDEGRGTKEENSSFFLAQRSSFIRQSFPECYAGRLAIYLDPYGSIFPCPVFWKEFGNIKSGNPLDVWNSAQAEQVRQEIAKFGCGGCWHICQIPLNIRKQRE
jgi:MoaA/NifB/PqqE/SkfB family radical SAM enzyme